jgi:prophage regulatory protein
MRSKRLISLPEVVHRTGMCRSIVYRLVSRDQFPRPVKVGRSTRWVDVEVDRWIDAAAAARGTVNSDKAA